MTNFWSDYFWMRRTVPSRKALVREHLAILNECGRRFDPHYEQKKFNPLARDSKRRARLLRMYWAMEMERRSK